MTNRMSFFQDLMTSVFNRDGTNELDNDSRSLEELCDALLSERGEVSGNRIANQILTRFALADSDAQLAFFKMLVTRFDIDTRQVQSAANSLAENDTTENLKFLLNCVEPKRQELFRRLNRIPRATGMLVNMRSCLLAHMKAHPDLERIDVDLQKLFRAWFNRGFLVLREIDWQTPANILEKLIAYEAVHAISSWDALRRRLAPADRKGFAFFHPSMPDEPLIFVEVALTKSSPDSIYEILSQQRDIAHPESTNTAVFYSISNCQTGLAGVSFGNFLIKQVAQELSMQLSGLKYFRTLTPVPGFMRWVEREHTQTTDDELRGRLEVVQRISTKAIETPNADEQQLLKEIAARYLVKEKRSDVQPLDPVARFHLGNGAALDRVIPCADVYKKGLKQSAGVMVSYLYDLEKVIENHEGYATSRKVVSSAEVRALLGEKRKFKRRNGKGASVNHN